MNETKSNESEHKEVNIQKYQIKLKRIVYLHLVMYIISGLICLVLGIVTWYKYIHLAIFLTIPITMGFGGLGIYINQFIYRLCYSLAHKIINKYERDLGKKDEFIKAFNDYYVKPDKHKPLIKCILSLLSVDDVAGTIDPSIGYLPMPNMASVIQYVNYINSVK